MFLSWPTTTTLPASATATTSGTTFRLILSFFEINFKIEFLQSRTVLQWPIAFVAFPSGKQRCHIVLLVIFVSFQSGKSSRRPLPRRPHCTFPKNKKTNYSLLFIIIYSFILVLFHLFILILIYSFILIVIHSLFFIHSYLYLLIHSYSFTLNHFYPMLFKLIQTLSFYSSFNIQYSNDRWLLLIPGGCTSFLWRRSSPEDRVTSWRRQRRRIMEW